MDRPSDRPQFEQGSRVIPLSLDWYDAIPIPRPTQTPALDQAQLAQTEAYTNLVRLSQGLPDDLIILATDVVRSLQPPSDL